MTNEGKSLKSDYIYQVRSQWNYQPPLEEPLEIILNFYFSDKKKRDWDNYNKLVCDAMEGIIFLNDSQIQKATVIKGYDKENPRVEIIIKIFNGEPNRETKIANPDPSRAQ